MKVCPACDRKYPEEANFCSRARCATFGRARRLAPLAAEVSAVGRRNLVDFPRKPGADDPPERLRALAQAAGPLRKKTRSGHLPTQVGVPRSARSRFDSDGEARKAVSKEPDPATLRTLAPT